MKKISTIFAVIALVLGTTAFAEQVKLNSPVIRQGDVITVTGNIPEEYAGQNVSLQVIKPNGTFGSLESISYIGEYKSSADGSFECTFTEPSSTTSDINYYVYVGSKGLEWACFTVAQGSANVLDYGAVNDLSADSSSAIQAAVDAVYAGGGGVVYFPAGSYLIENSINLYSNVTLQGRFESAVQINSQCGFSINSAENVCIDGLDIAGNGNSYIAKVNSSDNVRIKDIMAQNIALTDVNASENVVMSHCTADGKTTELTAIKVYNSGMLVDGNIFSGYSSAINADNSNITVNDNVFRSGKISFTNCRGANIFNNRFATADIDFVDCINGKFSMCNLSDGAKLSLCGGNDNFRVENNTIKSESKNVEMMNIGGENTPERLIHINGNNFWYGAAADGMGSGTGVTKINVANTDILTFSENYFNNTVILIRDCTNMKFSANMLMLENVLTADGEMLLLSNVSKSEVDGNSLINNAEQTVMSVGIKLSEQCENITIRNNSINGILSVYVIEANGGINIHNNYLDAILCSEEVSVSLINNRTCDGISVDVSYMPQSESGSRYFYTTPSDYLGKIYTDGEWKNFGEIADIEAKSFVIEQTGGTINAVYSAYDLESTDVMILAIYDDSQNLIKTDITKASDTTKISRTITLEDTGKTYTVKGFLWNGIDTMEPIYYTRELQTEVMETEVTE